MRKNLLALAAFSGILFASCSNEMDQMAEQQKEQNVIGFSTYSIMSKGAPITGNNEGSGDNPFAKKGSSFEVAAFLDQNDKKYLSAQIEHNGTSWNYKNDLDKAYWPSGSLNFFAVAPYSDFYPAAIESKVAKGTVTYANSNMKITYTVPTKTSEHQDLMYAVTAPITKPSEGKVQLNFKHALNQIHFKGRTDSKNLKVIINPSNGIQLCNLFSKGICTVTNNAGAWSGHNNTDLTPVPIFNNILPENTPQTGIVINTASVQLTNETDVLMLLPQPSELTPWDPNALPKVAASAQAGSYLKISCKLIALGEGGLEVYLHGSASTTKAVADGFADMYVPFNCSAMEESGKKITYTLIFGGGYTDEGQPILTPITFDTNVQNWVDANHGVDVDVPKQPLQYIN